MTPAKTISDDRAQELTRVLYQWTRSAEESGPVSKRVVRIRARIVDPSTFTLHLDPAPINLTD